MVGLSTAKVLCRMVHVQVDDSTPGIELVWRRQGWLLHGGLAARVDEVVRIPGVLGKGASNRLVDPADHAAVARDENSFSGTDAIVHMSDALIDYGRCHPDHTDLSSVSLA